MNYTKHKADATRKPEMTIREALKTNYQSTRQRGHTIRMANHYRILLKIFTFFCLILLLLLWLHCLV